MRCFRLTPFAALALSIAAPLTAAASQNPAVSDTTTTVIQNPGTGSNRIEVTGNTARNVRIDCGGGPRAAGRPAPQANVNSVNIEGAALQGRSVVIAGRNSRDVNVAGADCAGGAPAANVNSVNIR